MQMPLERPSFLSRSARAIRQALPWALTLAVATCTNDRTGPSDGGTGFFTFRPVYQGVTGSLSRFGIVADSVRVRLTRPIDELVLDTTVFFHPDSTSLSLALPIDLESSPESLSAIVEIKAGATLLFVDSLDVEVFDGPPSATQIPTVLLDYVGPGNNMAVLTLIPDDTTIAFGDTLFFDATAEDSSAQSIANFYVAWSTSNPAVATINGQGRLIAPNTRTSLQVIGETPTGIADTTVVTFAPVPNAILADSGNAQTGAAGDSLGALFVARVMAADALGVPGIPVRFQVVTGGGTIRDTLLVTDANGRVRTRGVLSTTSGAHSWSATVVGTALTTTFTATANAGTPAAIAITGGNNQVDSAGRPLPTALTVRVADAFNNPVPGAKIYWTRTVGTGTVAPDSSFTNGTGIAVTDYTLGAVGIDSITATIAGTGAFVSFQATAINGAPATVNKVLGDLQTDTIGRVLFDSLAVTVRSATNQPVVGAPVGWTVLRGGSVSLDTVLTDGNGRAAIAYTLGTAAGTDSVRAQAGGASALFTATALPGFPSTLAIVSGDAQSDTVGNALAQPLVVLVTDSAGNPVANTLVTWSRVGSGTLGDDSVLTDVAGHATITYVLGATPGVDSITATLACACTSVTFTATGLSAAPASIVTLAGEGQNVVVNTESTDTITVQVRDGSNNPIAGVDVFWSVIPAVGNFVPVNATGVMRNVSDSLGMARGVFTAGSVVGAVRIEAQTGAIIDSINVNQVAAPAAAIALISGNGQTDTLLTAIDLPFVVRVTDAFGNRIAGEQVAFTRIAGTGSLFADTILTDLNGDAAVGYLLGGTPGIDSIRATLVGTGGSVDFALTVVPGVPVTLSEIAGNLQFDTAHAVLATPMQVRVLDTRGNPVPGAEVTFAGTGGLAAQPAIDTADLNGDVSALITLGDSAGSWQMTATVTGVPVSASFDLTTSAAQAALIAIVSGDGQTDSTGNALPLPFVARVTDAYGNPVPGAAVLWQVQVGSGNATDDTTFADINGNTQVNYVLGAVPGPETIRATIVGTSAFVDFDVNAVSGAPAFLALITGNNQVDTVLSTLADSLVVELRDAGNNPVPGEWLYWTTAGMFVSADSTLTDANGRAAVQVTYDSIAFQGVVLAHTADTLIGMPFTLRIEAGLPAQLTPIGGNAQSAEVSTTLPDSLRVFVQDAYGNPADSALVTFSVTAGSGTVVPDTAMADSIGMAVASYTLGAIAGTDTILAQLVAQPVSFSFTATGTSGAAASLAYVSGTGQSQTVGTTLATGFTVQALDGASNPVGGAWVHWTVIAGGGSLPADSTPTDGAGAATITLTLGTTAGIDSVIATLPGLADTVAFYAVGTPDVASTLAKVSGDSQSATAASPLAAPLVVRLTDQYGNAIAGAGMDFTAGVGSGTVDSVVATTDANGFANSGVWTLGATGGTHTVSVTTALLPADTLIFIATSIPSGTSATWTGALSADFGNAGNWSPAAVPSGSDNVFIPDAVVNDPVLGGNVTIGGLTVESGASLAIGTNTLSLGGDVVIDGSVTRTGNGMVQYQGSGFMEGTVPVLRVINPLTMSGDLTVTDSLTLSGTGTLTVAGSTLTVGGNLSGTSGQLPTMLNPLDSVDVGGTVRLGAGGVWAPTAGVFVMRGPLFDVFTSSTVSTPSGTHRMVFAGGAGQQLRLANAGAALNRLHSVDIANPAGVVLTDNAAFTGTVRVLSGTLTSQTTQNALLAGGLQDTGAGWQPSTTFLAGATQLPDSLVGNVQLTNVAQTLPSDLRIKGTLSLSGPGLLTLGGNTLRLDSTLAISGSGSIVMQNVVDTLEVAGGITWNGSNAGGLLTAGTLIARGGFTASTASATFQSTGSHLTIFAGSALQTVAFPNNNGVGGNRFQDVVFANPAGVSFTSGAYITGTADVQAGAVTGSGVNISIQGTLLDPANGAWTPTTTTFTGVPTSFPDSIVSNVVFTGTNAVTLTADLRVTRSLSFIGSGASFDLNGFNLWGDSTLNVSGTHQVIMQNVADTFEVAEGVTWNGSTAGSLMTAGTLILRGNFTASTASSTFQPIGTHTTILAGSALQTVAFPNNNGVGGNRFQNVVFANPAGVSFTSGAYITGTADVQAGSVTGSGVNISIQGTLLDPANGAWTPTTTTFTGVPASFPDTIVSNVVFNAGVSIGLAKDLRIKRALSFTGSGGSIALNGFNLWADSTLTVTGTHMIIMQNPADTLEVQDGVTWNGSTASGILTDGVLLLRSNFGATTASSTFQATGTHTTVLAGSAPQTVSFPNNNGVAGNRFQNVTFANPAGVSFTSGAYVTGTADVQAGTVTGSGVNISIQGTLLDPANGAWTPTTTTFTGVPASFPDTIISNVTFSGNVAIALAKDLRITRALSFTGSGASFDLNGFNFWGDSTLTVTGTHQIVMQNAADTLEIAEGITWNGSTTAGLLTAGTVIARGNFGATTASTTFQGSGTHTVVFAGSAPQTVSFPNNNGPTGNRFQNAVFANAAGVSFTSGAYISGDAEVQAGSVTGSAVNVSIEGSLIDPANGAWTPTTTTFTGIPASFPDTIVSNVDFDNLGTITLAQDLRVKRALSFSRSGGIFSLGGFNLWADSTLTVTGGHQVVMQNAADTLDVAEGITWNGSSAAGLLTAGTIIARGDFTAPTATTTFQPTGTHTVVFAGAAIQNVGFPNNNGSTSNRFQNATFANPAGVNFTSDAYITGIADVQAGTVTAPGWELALGGTLLDPANGAWQPTVMSYRGAPTSFPDTLNTTVNFTAVDTITLTKDLRVKGALVFVGNTGARFEMNGFNLWADSSFYIISAHQFVMQNAADTLEVEDEISWTGATTPGLLTAGTIIAHADFTAPSSSATFQPSGSHKTVFAGGLHSVTFPNNRSFTGNRFHHMEMVNPSTVTIGSDIFVAGTFSNVAGPTGTLVAGSAAVLNTRGLSVDNLNFDQVRIAYSGPASFQLDNANFTNQDPAQTQVAIRTAGGLSVAINGASFTTTPTTGRYISATDTLANATPVILAMVGSTPLDGSAFELENVANDGATIDWSSLAFATQPLDAALGSPLDTVRVVALGPTGDTLTGYTGNVTVALGANPGNASLTGTTTVAAVAGVATFTDLAVDSVGTGYTLTAGTGDLPSITSALFNITIFQPVGFDVVWVGGTSTDWATPSNWNTGIVPDSTTNVYISSGFPNDPAIAADSFFVKRLQLAPGATLDIGVGTKLIADSTVEAGTAVNGPGVLVLRGTGDLSGTVTASIHLNGTYSVAGTASIAFMDIYGDLYLAADTLNVSGGIGTYGGTGRIHSISPDALIDNAGIAWFEGASTTGTLTAGTLRMGGSLTSAPAGAADAFAPSAGHLTVLNGSGIQTVSFFAPDSVSGSHFGRLQVSTAGTAFMLGRYNALGDLLITNGATLADSLEVGFEAHGFVGIDAGGALDVNNLRTRGGLGVAVGATYSVATTTYYGGGAFPINPAPYDTLVLQLQGQASGDLTITGDLRVDGGTALARFDPNGFNVNVAGSMNVVGNGALIMQDAADTLFITGNFSTNGASTDGLLTAGWLRIGGSFLQSSDGADEAFRAGTNHTTEFYFGGPTGRTIEFASPSGGPASPTGSHFGTLLLPIGFDTIVGRVPAAGKMFVAAALIQDTAFSGNELVGYDSVVVSSASPSVQLRTLEVWGGLEVQGAVPYDVLYTRIMGGPNGTLAPLAYQNLLIANTSQTLGANLTLPGRLDVGIFCSEVCTSSGGDLIVNGFDLIVGGDLAVMGLGQLHMAAGDSVDVTGDLTYRTSPSAGTLTGGTLVARAMFNTVGANAFQPDAGHHTVFAAPGDADLYPTSGSWFGRLTVLDNGIRRIRSSQAVVVLDTLMIGDIASTFSDSVFTVNGSLIAQGPVITVSGSRLRVSIARFDHNTLLISGSYLAGTTVFGGTGQAVPTSLTYNNVQVSGPNVYLTAPLDIGSNNFTVDGSAGPADLDLNGFSLAVGDFATAGNATLTSTIVGSGLLVRGDANFAGGDQTGRLTTGVLQIGGNFTQDGFTSAQSFAATGTLTEFFGAGTHSVTFANPSIGLSHFAGLSVLDGGTLQPTTSLVATGTTTIDTSSTFDGQLMGPGDAAQFTGKVRVLELGQMSNPGFASFDFRDSLITAATAGYSVLNTVFQGTDGIPDLFYTHLYLREGVHLTLTHRLAMSGGLNIQNAGNPADTVRLRLNGNKVSANGMYVDGYARITMDNVADTLEVFGSATFSGVDQDTAMTAGVIRIGGYLEQIGTYSAKSFAPAGTRTEFYGLGNHNVLFANPGVSLSHLRDLAVIGSGSSVTFTTTASVLGNVTVNAGATLTAANDGANVYFFGKVNALGSGAITNPFLGLFTFHDSLTVATPANYSVVNTAFQATNALPVLPYTNLYLNEGVHDTLAANLTVNGVLSLSGTSVGGQDLVLNGHTVNALTFTTQNEGRLTMANPIDSLIVGGNATFGGGDLTGRLTAGLLSIGGDFNQNGAVATGFVADSGHTTRFAGTGTHQVYFSTPSMTGGGGSHFGSLSFTTDPGIVLNVMSDIWAEGTLTTTGGSTPTVQNGTVPLRQLFAQDVSIDGIIFDHVQFHLAKATGAAAGAGAMNSVTFQNFLTSEDQFVVDLPGEATQYTWGGFTFTQLNTGDTGRYLVATDTDGVSPNVLDISLGTNNWGPTDPPFYVGFNGATIFPFAP